MATVIRLVSPVEHDGALIRSITVSRPSPLGFAKFWLAIVRGEHATPPAKVFDVPLAVVDALAPADHRRVIAELARLSRVYIWPIAVWRAAGSAVRTQRIAK